MIVMMGVSSCGKVVESFFLKLLINDVVVKNVVVQIDCVDVFRERFID